MTTSMIKVFKLSHNDRVFVIALSRKKLFEDLTTS